MLISDLMILITQVPGGSFRIIVRWSSPVHGAMVPQVPRRKFDVREAYSRVSQVPNFSAISVLQCEYIFYIIIYNNVHIGQK